MRTIEDEVSFIDLLNTNFVMSATEQGIINRVTTNINSSDSVSQAWIRSQLTNPKAVRGLRVKTKDGTGVIVDTKSIGHVNVEYSNGNINTYYVSSVEAVDNTDIPEDFRLLYSQLVGSPKLVEFDRRFQQIANNDLASLQNRKNVLEDEERRYKEELQRIEKDKTLVQASIANFKPTQVNYKSLLAQLKKNKQIRGAYIDEALNLYIFTKPLHLVPNPKVTDAGEWVMENKDKLLGSFVIKVNLLGELTVFNYTHVSVFETDNDNDEDRDSHGTYAHPNVEINGSVCQGNNSTQIRYMIKNGQFCELADFMIFFLSTFPHDAGRPFMDRRRWLKDLQPIIPGTVSGAPIDYLRYHLNQPLIPLEEDIQLYKEATFQIEKKTTRERRKK